MTDSRRGSGETPEELASALRDQARSAATTALRTGLEDIEDRHGQHVADEVAALVDVDGVFAGLNDPVPARRGRPQPEDDEPYEFKPVGSL
jgi:2-keto-3-deoxy-L-rhamnonate aldolase RhmA